MTVAGDPLDVFEEDDTVGRALLGFESKGFTNLRAQIDDAVHNRPESQVVEIWTRKSKVGTKVRGLVIKIASSTVPPTPVPEGFRVVTRTFKLFLTAGNLDRAQLRLTVGDVITKAEAMEFAKDFDATLVKAWRTK